LGSEKANGVKKILQVGFWSCLLLIIVLLISSWEPPTGHTFSYNYRSVCEDESVKCELWGSGLGARKRTARVQWMLGLRISTRFFCCIYSTPNWTGSVRLGFCRFQVSETETEPNQIFFKIFNRFNRFFLRFGFFNYFFLDFFSLIDLSIWWNLLECRATNLLLVLKANSKDMIETGIANKIYSSRL
jgi:hypothetical protein